MTSEITEDDIIKALLECVKRADWNCAAHDKPELYNIWNELTYPDDSKGQMLINKILQALQENPKLKAEIEELKRQLQK